MTTKSAPPKSTAPHEKLIVLVLALAFVLGCRLLLYVWMPDRSSDFDLLYRSAALLVQGENPYPPGLGWFPYPLPAVLLAVPFTWIPLALARPVFDVLVGWAFVYALWKHRGLYALLALLSGTYLFAMANGQTTPLMVAASLIPVLGFLLAAKPNTSAALWISRPSWLAVLGVILALGLSLAVLPTWPRDWWMALPTDKAQLAPPILRPLGFLLLLAAIRWRLPEGRLILAIAFIPQTTLPYELVPLALIPGNRLEMAVYVVGSWITVVAADRLGVGQGMAQWAANGWPVTLAAVYAPMLYLVLRRGRRVSVAQKLEKERRRPHRIPDDELRVDVNPKDDGGVTVTVTHLPTRLFSTESAPKRQQAERRAQDKLAALVAEMARRPDRAVNE
jgi:hypothetical protein